MPSEIVIKCSKAIAAKGWNIAFAESATAGRMCAEFSMTKHSGDILLGGIVCYEAFVKTQILHVSQNLIDFTFTPKHSSSILDGSTQTLKAFYFFYYTKSIQ